MAKSKNCETWKKEIAASAKSCPHCGKTRPFEPSLVQQFFGVVFLLIIIAVIVYAYSGDDPDLYVNQSLAEIAVFCMVLMDWLKTSD